MNELDMAMFAGLNVLSVERTITQRWENGHGPSTEEEVMVDIDGTFSIDAAIKQFAEHGYGTARIESGSVTRFTLHRLRYQE